MCIRDRPHPSELSREPAISGPSSVSSPAASSSVVSQNVVSSITSAICSAVLESLKSAGIIPQEPVQTSDPAAAVQGSVAQVVQNLTGEGHTLTSTSITRGPGARFSKVPIINGPGKLLPFTLKIEVSVLLHLT